MTGLLTFFAALTDSLTVGAITSASAPNISAAVTLTDGTGANQANRKFTTTGTLSASASATLDLSAPGTDEFNRAVAPTRLVCLLFVNTGTTVLTLGGAASNAWTSAFSNTVTLRAGGSAVFLAPDATGLAVGSSNKNLQILNTSGTTAGSYSLLLVGSQP